MSQQSQAWERADTNKVLTQGVRPEASPCTRQTRDGVEVVFAAAQKNNVRQCQRAKSTFENNLGL